MYYFTHFPFPVSCKFSFGFLFVLLGLNSGISSSLEVYPKTDFKSSQLSYDNDNFNELSNTNKVPVETDWIKQILKEKQAEAEYRHRRLLLAEESQKRELQHLKKKKGWWSSTATSYVIAIFIFCFLIAIYCRCCSGKSSRSTRTIQNPTFIFAGIGGRDGVQHHYEITSILASISSPQRSSSFPSAACAAPPPRYCDATEDPPPDYYKAMADANSQQSPNTAQGTSPSSPLIA